MDCTMDWRFARPDAAMMDLKPRWQGVEGKGKKDHCGSTVADNLNGYGQMSTRLEGYRWIEGYGGTDGDD
jgi:hypothetical protein